MLLAILSLLAVAVVHVSAQVFTNATCLPTFSWMSNSKGQSPCLVGAYLQAACNNGNWLVVNLPFGTHYIGPTQAEINPCQCSTVTYSLMSACGLCQKREAESWSAWSYNCTSIYPDEFTENIPANTAVPAWAYLDVRTLDQVNLTAAQADSNAPESTGTAKPTGSLTNTPSSAPSSSASSHSSNTGAIAGGVVGGVVGLGLIAGAILIFVIRRRQSHMAPSAAFDGYGVPIDSPLPMSQPVLQGTGAQAPPQLYNRADPSSYPPSATIYTSSILSAPHNQPGQAGHYNFIPEI